MDSSDVLKRHLGRTSAPDELWRKLRQEPEEQRPRRHLAWATATAVLILFTMWGLRASTEAPVTARNAQLACVACHT